MGDQVEIAPTLAISMVLSEFLDFTDDWRPLLLLLLLFLMSSLLFPLLLLHRLFKNALYDLLVSLADWIELQVVLLTELPQDLVPLVQRLVQLSLSWLVLVLVGLDGGVLVHLVVSFDVWTETLVVIWIDWSLSHISSLTLSSCTRSISSTLLFNYRTTFPFLFTLSLPMILLLSWDLSTNDLMLNHWLLWYYWLGAPSLLYSWGCFLSILVFQPLIYV